MKIRNQKSATLIKIQGAMTNSTKEMDEQRFATEGSTERPRAERPADLERLWKVTDSCCGFLLLIFTGFNRSLIFTKARFRVPFLCPASIIFSWIFSQTRGTAKNLVGRTALKFSTWKWLKFKNKTFKTKIVGRRSPLSQIMGGRGSIFFTVLKKSKESSRIILKKN